MGSLDTFPLSPPLAKKNCPSLTWMQITLFLDFFFLTLYISNTKIYVDIMNLEKKNPLQKKNL
jgi:hypothetical protein